MKSHANDRKQLQAHSGDPLAASRARLTQSDAKVAADEPLDQALPAFLKVCLTKPTKLTELATYLDQRPVLLTLLTRALAPELARLNLAPCSIAVVHIVIAG